MTTGSTSSTAAAAEPLSATLPASGFDLHYWEWPGTGPTLVCLHPSSHYGRIWEWVAQQLAPAFTVLAPDQRGHGDSGQPPSGNAAEDYAADLDTLLNARGLERVVLAGHSLGARSAMVYAGLHPERVSHLVLVGGPHFSTLQPGADVEHWQSSVNAMRKRPRQVASAEAAAANLRASYPHLSEAAIAHEVRFNTRPGAAGGVEWKYAPDWVADGLLHTLDDLRQYAARVRCPVLILRARGSWELTDERMPVVTAAFSGAQVTVKDLEGANTLELEAPQAVAAAIREFVHGR